MILKVIDRIIHSVPWLPRQMQKTFVDRVWERICSDKFKAKYVKKEVGK